MKQLREWNDWECSWLVGPLRNKRDELREYTRHYFTGVWYVREQGLMDSALEHIVDRASGEFLLTPREFGDCIGQAGAESSSAIDFQERLERAVINEHGRRPDNNYHVKRDLMQFEVDQEAPDYIKESALSIESKHALLRLHERLCRRKERGPGHPFDDEPQYLEDALKAPEASWQKS